jgi:site-specific DNA-adenine methylase
MTPEIESVIAGPLKSPYPWFGGKAAVASDVWAALGKPPNYVEPFFGGGAVLLARPHFDEADPPIETVNDLNAWLCNFWRAVKVDPDQVAYYAADPVSELDLHARGDWLFYRPGVDKDFIERLRGDPDYYCAKSAGWWAWGQSSWIGANWGRQECRSLPHLGDAGQGVNRQLPHLGSAGMGVNRKLPHLGDAGQGDDITETGRRGAIREYMRQLCRRMAKVRVCCGDFSRVLGPAVTSHLGLTGVFLDPPYGVEDRASVFGEHESRTVAADVLAWCKEHGANPMLRIILAGYAGEHDGLKPLGWRVVAWKTRGGYSNQSSRDNENAARERLWFSPTCIRPGDSLFPQEPAK